METYYRDIARRWVLSLHYVIVQPLMLRVFSLMNLTLKTKDPENKRLTLTGIPVSDIINTIRDHVQKARPANHIVELNYPENYCQ
jgi:hypothetical protein